MTTIRTVAAHEVVRAVYPRPVTERDEVAMATGKAIDEALSRMNFEAASGRRPTLGSSRQRAAEVLDQEIRDAHLDVPDAARVEILAQVEGVLRAFRNSELFGLPRPRSRLMVIDGQAGVYVQPDYWDGRARFYEMKSYRAIPPPPDVALQLQLFQLGFPGFSGILACYDRHVSPVTTTMLEIAAPTATERSSTLARASQVALESGVEKVLEYVDVTVIRYDRSPPTR